MSSRILKWMARHQAALRAGVGLIVALITGLAAPIVIEDYKQEGLGNALVGGFFALGLILSVILNAGFLQNILRRIELLDRRHRLRIEFVAARQSGAPDAVHRRARAFLDHAELKDGCEIFGVNSYLEATSHGDDETDAIREYYATIETLAKRGAHYTRVVQLPSALASKPYSKWAAKTKQHYKSHFDNVLTMRQGGDLQFCDLLQAKSRFPLSFLLIRNANGSHYLIWQVDEQIEEGDQNQPRFRLHGIFLVEDPDRSIVDHFLACINQLRNAGQPVEVESQSGKAQVGKSTSGVPQE